MKKVSEEPPPPSKRVNFMIFTIDNNVHNKVQMKNVGDKWFPIFSVKLKILVIDGLRVIISISSVTVNMDQQYKV